MTTKKTVGVAKTKKVITKVEVERERQANQYIFDPRQKLCWDLYIDPTSDTFGNALQSAVKAGYVYDTAKNITTERWFRLRINRLQMLDDAEKVLKEMVTMKTKNSKIVGTKFVEMEDSQLVKIKQDTAKFLAERLGKDDGYSGRNEVTGKNGKELGSTSENRELRGSLLDKILGR